ncbi:hypothetical protein GGTG_02944 [Gaeumannomyces tritici R3-111a-1]|uniref:Uncharacterized protein n=1 Tax=Gaeumannomyces tritici (strain R3-111a-1) TaxID=644352 RepID=J3NNT8_GAET3|nr:hypothetical protein GGTG_02944 [Gaeumannomyces tritici R3-111a-1]EJT77841.1 hypothetical protein GGTG_02944 [Gaeumannomyces tritici R3-111a-1]
MMAQRRGTKRASGVGVWRSLVQVRFGVDRKRALSPTSTDPRRRNRCGHRSISCQASGQPEFGAISDNTRSWVGRANLDGRDEVDGCALIGLFEREDPQDMYLCISNVLCGRINARNCLSRPADLGSHLLEAPVWHVCQCLGQRTGPPALD